MNPKFKYLTSFVTQCGQYVFKVILFGQKNVTAMFQHTTNQLLISDRSYAEVYLDDIVIFLNN